MIKKILLLLIILVNLTVNFVYAENTINNETKKWFNNYSKTITSKYSTKEQILFYEGLGEKLNEILERKKLNDSQIKVLNDLNKLINEKRFYIELIEKEKNNKQILQSNNLSKDFNFLSYNKEHIFIENWIWYTYSFDKHLIFQKWVNIKKEDLAYNWINTKTSILFLKEDWNLGFIVNYKKIKLISDSIIYWIPNKYNFLKEIKDDKKELNYETDELFKKIKSDTLSITKWKNKSSKITVIYDYILNNIEYPKTFSLDDSKIFSWIDTYKNKLWICEWYTKLFMYMLNFANINNTAVIRWYVLDAPDFPQIWHAWVKIWDKYYDPTFDDPIWNTKTKQYNQYFYYWLPKDLFYTNRYDFNEIPEYLKEKDITFRKAFINNNISKLLTKYRNSWYNILKPYILKIDNWIKIDKVLDIQDLKKILWFYEVEKQTFKKDWIIKNIKSLKFYLINNEVVELLASQIDYNFDWYYLFKWKLDNWNYEYRLAYNVILD